MMADQRLNKEWWCAKCQYIDGPGCLADGVCKNPYQDVSVIIAPSQYKKKDVGMTGLKFTFHGIVSKKDWKNLKNDELGTLTFYKESELHHFFGDDPESEIVRLKIEKEE